MNRIKELRKKLGMNQKQLAAKLNIADSTLSYWENGKFEPDQKNIFAMSEMFDVSIDYLLGKSDTPSPPELSIPNVLQNVPMAFHRGEFEDLTQGEVDALARIAMEFKAVRKA